MAHALTDDVERDVLAAGDAGPGVPGDVGTERDFDSCLAGHLFKLDIDEVEGVLVLPTWIVLRFYNRQ